MTEQSQETVNIQVVVRARPLNESEAHKSTSFIRLNEATNIVEARKKPYSFDAVYPSETDQETFFRSAAYPLLNEFLRGFNCSIFAYGQTGSGKTYTMSGEGGGVIPRSIDYLFEQLNGDQTDFYLRCSFMEVYNEEIYDLLEDVREPLRLFEERQQTNAYQKNNKLVVQNLTEVLVSSPREVRYLLFKAASNRKTAETLMNERSSRSHSIFCVYLIYKQIEINQNTNYEIEFIKISKLNLVDLAGSENISKSGASGQQLQEASRINKSLLTFGRVINCLTEGKPHVPYRESKLTRLLQDSLGGKTKTAIIATISPSDLQIEETTSTLDYMTRAKKIKNAPEIMYKINSKTLLKEQTAELKRLRALLDAQREYQGGVFVPDEEYQNYQDFVNNRNDRIKELEVLIYQYLAEIAYVAQLLDAQRERYNAVKKELKNAVGQITNQREDLGVFQQKIAQGRVYEQQNMQELEAFKLDFQVRVDAEFSVSELDKRQEESGYKHACADFAQKAMQTQKAITEQGTQLERAVMQLHKTSSAEIEQNLQKLIADVAIEISQYIEQNIAKPAAALDSKAMTELVATLLQKRLAEVADNFKTQYTSSEITLRQIIEDSQKITAERVEKMHSGVQAFSKAASKAFDELKTQIGFLQTENRNLRLQLAGQMHERNANLKQALLQAVESICTQYSQAQEDEFERGFAAFQQRCDGTSSEMMQYGYYNMDSALQFTTEALDSMNLIGKQVAHALTVNYAELNKLGKTVAEHNKETNAMAYFTQQLHEYHVIVPIQTFQYEMSKYAQEAQKRLRTASSEACGQLSAQTYEILQYTVKTAKAAAQRQTSLAYSYPQSTEIQRSVVKTLKLLQDSVNAVVLANLQHMQYQTVLPKNRTPVVASPPFRRIGMENSGVIGVQTPTMKKREGQE